MTLKSIDKNVPFFQEVSQLICAGTLVTPLHVAWLMTNAADHVFHSLKSAQSYPELVALHTQRGGG